MVVESPTFATKIWFCLKMMIEAVVPAVLRSPILFVFHEAKGGGRGEGGGGREGVSEEVKDKHDNRLEMC